MEVEAILKLLVLLVGFYMAWNIGANDVSNAMGTSVGSGALTLSKAVMIAAVLEFSGAFFVGSKVSETMQKGLLDTQMFLNDPITLVLGMSAALLGTSIWLQISSYFGWPVSTTHAIVGSILGFGGVVGGIDTIQWGHIGTIASSWIIAPVSAALISYLIFYFLQRTILFAMNPVEACLKVFPFLAFLIFFTFTLSLIFNGLDQLSVKFTLPQMLGIAFLIGGIASLITYIIARTLGNKNASCSLNRHTPLTVISLSKALKHLNRVHAHSSDETKDKVAFLLKEVRHLSETVKEETHFAERASEYHKVEKMFVYLQIISACFVAFAHGANDVANAIGPVAAVLDILHHGSVPVGSTSVPSWLLAFGGLGIVIGLATWGWRVIETIGKKITELTPSRGFCAEFGAATTILIASKLGMPISTTHSLVGAVLGVGFAGGLRALNLSMLRDIMLSWIITLPASAGISILVFYGLKAIFI